MAENMFAIANLLTYYCCQIWKKNISIATLYLKEIIQLLLFFPNRKEIKQGNHR